jgi:hypothetical protein
MTHGKIFRGPCLDAEPPASADPPSISVVARPCCSNMVAVLSAYVFGCQTSDGSGRDFPLSPLADDHLYYEDLPPYNPKPFGRRGIKEL